MLADALDAHGWSIWWDPQLQAGEYFDDVIEEALVNAKCVVVLWSKRSVRSRFVKDEATYALEEGILVPAQIEDVRLPFRFANIHTVQLLGWDGSVEDDGYQRLTSAIEMTIGSGSRETDDRQLLEVENSTSHFRRRHPAGAPRDGTDGPEQIASGAEFHDVLRDGSQGPAMVAIPAGSFQMGDGKFKDENPAHEVTFREKFAIGKYPVAFQEYDLFASITDRQLPNDNGWDRYQHPVINVSWHDAVAYTAWLSEQTGAVYRLPSESEWEYACRAGTNTQYWWGDDLGEYGGIAKTKRFFGFTKLFNKRTTPVGEYPANRFNLHDTSGNVFEWVNDCWHENYNGAPADGSPWLEDEGGNCHLRMLRGGAWDANPEFMRSVARHKYHPGLRYVHVGFRIVREI